MKNNKLILSTGVVFLAILLFSGCDQNIDQSNNGEGETTSTSLTLVWPEGYRYNQADNSLASPISGKNRQAPDYVTDIILTITGEDIDPIEVNIDKSTLQATVDVAPGLRRFSVVVRTIHRETFTGFVVEQIVRGSRPTIVITLEVNAPPKVEVIMTPTRPQKGDTATLTAVVTDPDLDDVHIITWYVIGPDGTREVEHGPEVGGIIDMGGTYRARVVVDDQHGGVVTQEHSFFVANYDPVISGITASPIYVDPGETTELTCNAFDRDNDVLHFDWMINGNYFDSGRTIFFTVPGDIGEFIISCEVTDDLLNVKSGQRASSARFVAFDIEYHMLKAELFWNDAAAPLSRELDVELRSPDGYTVSASSTDCGDTGGGGWIFMDAVSMNGFLPSGTYDVAAIGGSTCSTPTDQTYRIKVISGGDNIQSFQGTSPWADPTNTNYSHSFATNYSGALARENR